MNPPKLRARILSWMITLTVFLAGQVALAENIDPDNDDSQYAWGENVGWLNLEPDGDGGQGVEVGDSELTGWIWGENIGWTSLSCTNTGSCATVPYGVTNDGNGGLAGYAWAENAGWISFSCQNTASCGTADYGVAIDPATGVFSGFAWAENVGWISFAHAEGAPKTSWRGPAPPWAAAPPVEASGYGTGSPGRAGIVNVSTLLALPVGVVLYFRIRGRKRRNAIRGCRRVGARRNP